MPTELQDAADRLANRIPLEPGDREVLVEAARKYVNGVHIQYCVKHESRMPYGATHCQIIAFPNNDPCDADDYLLVFALGVTEDTDGQ